MLLKLVVLSKLKLPSHMKINTLRPKIYVQWIVKNTDGNNPFLYLLP